MVYSTRDELQVDIMKSLAEELNAERSRAERAEALLAKAVEALVHFSDHFKHSDKWDGELRHELIRSVQRYARSVLAEIRAAEEERG